LVNHPYKYESPRGGFFGLFPSFLLKGTYFSSGGFSVGYGDALSSVLSMHTLDIPTRREITVGPSIGGFGGTVLLLTAV
jgi:hypothetical protein